MWRWPAGGVAVVLALSGCGGDPGSAAACAGAQVTVSPVSAAPGQDVRVQAEYLWTDCYDTGQPGTPPPMQGVTIVFEGPGSPASTLATVDADPEGRIDVTVAIPDDAAAGPAELVVAEWVPTAVQVTAP